MSQYQVLNPATGVVEQEFATATDAQCLAAITAADSAHKTWSKVPVAQRAEIVHRIGQLHIDRQDELAAIINREMGKPLADAAGEVEFSGFIYQYYADNAATLLADLPIELSDGEGSAVIRKSSVGAILGIMPWNFPAYQVARFAGPNLVAGNTVILKHSTVSRISISYCEDFR
jgi:succinate-semialdehyde dehydrogenase / glutarate-semialdehyde dehydrogenase